MKTPELTPPPHTCPPAQTGWRDLIHPDTDMACIEGFALEHLIDRQRGRAATHGVGPWA